MFVRRWLLSSPFSFFFFNLNCFFIKVTQVQSKRGLITNSHNLETNYPLDILAVQDTPCKSHLSDRMPQVNATYSCVELCCASSPLKNDEEFNILIRKGIKIMLYFYATFLIQRSQVVFPLIQLVNEYSTGIHVEFSGVVHRMNAPLHEHSQQELRYFGFQPPLSLILIK